MSCAVAVQCSKTARLVKVAHALRVRKRWRATRSITYDFGRHLTMLPSRGLRPAQFAPLNSRHSTYIYSNASRKVRILYTLGSAPQHTSASAGRRVTVAAMESRAHACGTAIAAIQ